MFLTRSDLLLSHRNGSPRGKANVLKKPPWQLGIQELITRNQTPPKQPPGSSQPEASPSNCINAFTREEEEIDRVEERKEEVRVNLCGAVELGDVRSLLKEWIASTDGEQGSGAFFFLFFFL